MPTVLVIDDDVNLVNVFRLVCVAKGYELAADGKSTTIFLRKGMKWSDGQPFTADDFVFWYEDIYQNRELVATPIPEVQERMRKLNLPEKHILRLEGGW